MFDIPESIYSKSKVQTSISMFYKSGLCDGVLSYFLLKYIYYKNRMTITVYQKHTCLEHIYQLLNYSSMPQINNNPIANIVKHHYHFKNP